MRDLGFPVPRPRPRSPAPARRQPPGPARVGVQARWAPALDSAGAERLGARRRTRCFATGSAARSRGTSASTRWACANLSCRRRECTVGTWVGAAVGRGGGASRHERVHQALLASRPPPPRPHEPQPHRSTSRSRTVAARASGECGARAQEREGSRAEATVARRASLLRELCLRADDDSDAGGSGGAGGGGGGGGPLQARGKRKEKGRGAKARARRFPLGGADSSEEQHLAELQRSARGAPDGDVGGVEGPLAAPR
jgi:hypothetical protein